MRATPETIWQVPAYLPYVQPALTDSAIAAAEDLIGYKFPEEYLNLLRRQNGGYIRFSLPEMVHDTIAGIGPFFPSIAEIDWEECQEYVSYPLKGLIPFDGDGHWHLCLDYRKSRTSPAITYADIECDSQVHVADSFAEYLTLLRLDVDGEYVLNAVSDLEGLKQVLSRELGTQFDSPDSWAHGYPTERARLGTDASPEWLWISPNVVSRGFVRSDDPRFLELKDRMPGSSDRFPGLPAASYILSATEGVKARVIEACIRSGLSIRPLSEYVAGS